MSLLKYFLALFDALYSFALFCVHLFVFVKIGIGIGIGTGIGIWYRV